MKLATATTSIRIILSPVFFFLFTFFIKDAYAPLWVIILLWAIFVIIEVSDWFDGMIARARNEVSDFGKLFDPFADSFARLTYFLSFVVTGIMPAWIFMLVIYRDISVSFIRVLQMKNGVAMGARISGKIKAWVYAITGVAGIGFITIQSIPELSIAIEPSNIFLTIANMATAITAIWTLLDYAYSLKSKKKAELL